MRCKYELSRTRYSGTGYSCTIHNQTFPDQTKLSFYGNQLSGKSQYDVDRMFIFNCNTPKVPRGITSVYPNVTHLEISCSKLKELFCEDLFEYRNLKSFACVNNPISLLRGDLFKDLKRLEVITFINNQLQVIEPNILEGLVKLRHVNFEDEPNYDICYSVYDQERSQARLDDVKAKLSEKYFSRGKFLKEYKASVDTLKEEYRKLNDEKSTLNQENCKLKQENCRLEKVVSKLDQQIIRLHAEVSNEKQEKWKLESEVLVLKNEILKVNSDRHKGLFADFKKYLQNEESKDLKITIDHREFRAHKFVLAIRSPTLAKKFHESPEANSLNLVDISVGVFDRILKYIYTNEVPRNVNVLSLYGAAGRLQINELKDYAATKIVNCVNIDNALEVFELSCKFGDECLKRKAFVEIKKKYPTINFRDEWLTQSEKLGKIIEGFKKQEDEMKKFEQEFNKK